MHFRIAKTFTDSLARLGPRAQTAAKTAAFDLQVDPAHPGLNFHPVKGVWDTGLRRVRTKDDICHPFPRPETGRIAVKVINHFGDEVMQVFGV
jgi:hypothetical protein